MVHFNAQFRSLRVVIAFVLSTVVFSCRIARAEERVATEQALMRIRAIAANLEVRLEMTQNVQIWIVPVDERMVSVERIHKGASADDVFIIQLDQSFQEGLNDEELQAAIAHELGHVWIFCHHPYLQTEALANEIAMRVVSRDSMKKVYAKLWLHLGTSGDFEKLLGTETKTPANGAAASNVIMPGRFVASRICCW